nr:response regulator [Desulfobulbaceae bacterium]
MRTLIVDDDLMSRLVLIEFLMDYGKTDVAVDGVEAIVAYKTELQAEDPYNLILLDIMMPNMDGIEALSKIRKIEDEQNITLENKAKIIMVTALHDEKTIARAIAANCNAYLTKPVSPKELYSKLAEFKLID